MCSNMEYRMLLIQNADEIIHNNQVVAVGNCSDISPILNTRPLAQVPYLFAAISTPQLPHDNPSDLKDTYLHKYIGSAVVASNDIRVPK